MESKLFLDRGRSCVYLPELDKPQSEYRYQRKMFAFHKNMHSAGFIIGTDSVTQIYRDAVVAAYRAKQSKSPPSYRHSISDLSRVTELSHLREQLKAKQAELNAMKGQHRSSASELFSQRPKLRASSLLPEELKVPLVINLAAKRPFAYPRYTHSHPKPTGLNPITGLRTQSVLRVRSEAC